MKKRGLFLACAIPVALLVFAYLTVLFIPNEVIKGVLVRGAENAGYTLALQKVSKALPLGVKAQDAILSSEKGELLHLSDARVALKVLPLFLGKVRFGYRAKIGAGEIEGDLATGKAQSFTLSGERIRLEDIPFFATVAGARVKGELKVKGNFAQKPTGPAGELQLLVVGADLAGLKIGETPLPDASYREVRGALAVEGGRATLKSFTLDGADVYVRLKGDMPLAAPLAASPLNLTLEMMPKPAFLERQKLVFLLLTKYQTTPGAFSVPVRGTLGHPSI